MVIYDLQCVSGHCFEGWFPNAGAFEIQKANGLISCSVCGQHDVNKIPSGGKRQSGLTEGKPQSSTPISSDTFANIDPVVLMKTVQRFIQSQCKDVGKQFTEKAIQMNRGEIPKDAIYGTASDEQREMLEEEGIVYTVIPKLTEEFEN